MIEQCFDVKLASHTWSAVFRSIMRVRVFETDDPNSEPSASLGAVREVDLGQEGASPRHMGLSNFFQEDVR